MSRTYLDKLLSGDVLAVAEQLLGWTLRSTIGDMTTAVTIVETEAYAGSDDPASHAYRGPTPRNATMFARAGLLYVYRSYGVHWCMNVVVGEEGVGNAVLLRAGDVAGGHEAIVQRRGRTDHLTDGPGKLCRALGVTGAHDGTDLRSGPVRLELGPGLGDRRVERTPRIGISRATDRRWRFVAVG